MEDVNKIYDYETQKVTHNLLKSNVENLTKEAKRKRLYRTQLLDLILIDRYETDEFMREDKNTININTQEDKAIKEMTALEQMKYFGN